MAGRKPIFDREEQRKNQIVVPMSELLGGMDCPRNISTEFHQLMIETYKRRVANAKLLGERFDFLDKCIRFIMDDDGYSGRENYADWLNNRKEVK